MTKGKKSPNLNSRQDPNKMRELAFLAIEKELQKLNDRLDLNKDNVIELMSAVLSVMNSPDVNYQHNSIIDLGLHGCTLLHVAAALNCDKIADCLIKAGADVNSKDHDMRTPLYYAAMYGKTEVAKLLIERGADVNLKDARDRTPLQVALEEGHLKTAKLLIDKGADRSCVPAYITKTSKLEGEATAVIMVIITTAVIPLVLIENTELSASVITGATIASMLIVGSIAFGLAYMWKKHELSSILSEVKHDNSISQQQAEKI